MLRRTKKNLIESAQLLARNYFKQLEPELSKEVQLYKGWLDNAKESGTIKEELEELKEIYVQNITRDVFRDADKSISFLWETVDYDEITYDCYFEFLELFEKSYQKIYKYNPVKK